MIRHGDNLLIEIAANLNIINEEQYREALTACERDSSLDPVVLLLDKGYITPAQHAQLSSIIENNESSLNQLPADNSAGTQHFTLVDALLNTQTFHVTTPNGERVKRVSQRGVKSDTSKPARIALPDHEPGKFVEREQIYERVSETEEVYTRQYTIRGSIGQGGLGRVFLAFDRCIGREVAIKEILQDALAMNYRVVVARFINEAKITGQLEHPGIVPIYELGLRPNGSFYYVMKYVRGKTFSDALRECRHDDPRQALQQRLRLLDSLIDVCEAMSYAHSKGVIHRDLKPANVVLGKFSETMILDWGLAKIKNTEDLVKLDTSRENVLSELRNNELTMAGQILGTPFYMAPEQVDAKFGIVDQQCDVFALGVILFELLTGERPYRPDQPGDIESILNQLVSDEPPPDPKELCKFIPDELATICRRAMSKDKLDRFYDAGELAQHLRAFREGRMLTIHSYSIKQRLRRAIRQNRAMVVAALIVFFLAYPLYFMLQSFLSEAERATSQADYAKSQWQQAEARASRALSSKQQVLRSIADMSSNGAMKSMQGARLLQSHFDGLLQKMIEHEALLDDVDHGALQLSDPLFREIFNQHELIISVGLIDTSGTLLHVHPEKFKYAVGGRYAQLPEFEIYKDAHPSVARRVPATPEGFDAITYFQPVIADDMQLLSLLVVNIPLRNAVHHIVRDDPTQGTEMIMCLLEDGEVLYHNDDSFLKMNIFRSGDARISEGFRDIRDNIRKELYGVSYYTQYLGKNRQESLNIIAWDTARFGDVNLRYVVKQHYDFEK